MQIIRHDSAEPGRSNYKGTHPSKDRARAWEIKKIVKLSKKAPHNSRFLVLASREGLDIECLLSNGVDSKRIIACEIYTKDFEDAAKKYKNTDITMFCGDIVNLPKDIGPICASYIDGCGTFSQKFGEIAESVSKRTMDDGIVGFSGPVANRISGSSLFSRRIVLADRKFDSLMLSERYSFLQNKYKKYVSRLAQGLVDFLREDTTCEQNISWPRKSGKRRMVCGTSLIRFTPVFGRYYDGSTSYALVAGYVNHKSFSRNDFECWNDLLGREYSQYGNCIADVSRHPEGTFSIDWNIVWHNIRKLNLSGNETTARICSRIALELDKWNTEQTKTIKSSFGKRIAVFRGLNDQKDEVPEN